MTETRWSLGITQHDAPHIFSLEIVQHHRAILVGLRPFAHRFLFLLLVLGFGGFLLCPQWCLRLLVLVVVIDHGIVFIILRRAKGIA